jgi:hypothetical protein
MGIIKKFKEFFSKVNSDITIYEQADKQAAQGIEQSAAPTEPATNNLNEPICAHCGLTIPEDNYTNFAGKKLHRKPCFRELRKEAKKMI